MVVSPWQPRMNWSSGLSLIRLPKHYSHSSRSMFMGCPRKFYYHYTQQLRGDDPKGVLNIAGMSDALLFGSWVSKWFEDSVAGGGLKSFLGMPTWDGTWGQLRDFFPPEVSDYDLTRSAFWMNEGDRSLIAFIDGLKEQKFNSFFFREFTAEDKMVMTLAGSDLLGYKDLVLKDNDHIHIIENKTANYNGLVNRYTSNNAKSHQQLQLYGAHSHLVEGYPIENIHLYLQVFERVGFSKDLEQKIRDHTWGESTYYLSLKYLDNRRKRKPQFIDENTYYGIIDNRHYKYIEVELTEEIIENTVKDYESFIRMANNAHANRDFPQNSSNCNAFGEQCAFYDLCWSPTKEEKDDALKKLYRVGE